MNRILRASIAAILLAGVARAQPVVGSSPSAPLIPESLRSARASASFSLGLPALEGPALHWGPVDLRPHLVDEFIYSDGILFGPGRSTNTYINSLSLGVRADFGPNWIFDYTPTWMVYTNSRFHNTLNHAVSLSGGMELADWLAQFDQSYTKSNTPRIETGRQTAQEVSSTRLDVSHRMTDSLSIELAGAQTLQFIEQSPDYYDWSTNGWLTYRATTRIDFSLGYRWGYTDFDPGAYMTYSEPMARLRWRVTDKISVNVQAGQERRQIHKHGVPVQETPTYDGSLEWRPFKYTGVMVRAQRSVSPSYFTNSVSENQGWSADLEQRLLGRYTLNAGIGRQRSHFSGSHTEFDADVTVEDVLDENGEVIGQIYHVTYTPRNVIDLRNDSTKTFHVRLSTPILQRGTFAVLYRRTENSSDVAGFNFTSHQVGCELSFRF